MKFGKFDFLVGRTDQQKQVEILPPKTSESLPREHVAIDEKARRVAAAAGSIVGSTMAGFVSGVAKHTITPAAQSVTRSAAKTSKSVGNFFRLVLIGIFVVVLSTIGLLALIVSSSPRR